MSKTTKFSKIIYITIDIALLWRLNRKTNGMYCNELSTSSYNKSKKSWEIIDNDISNVYNKIIQIKFKFRKRAKHKTFIYYNKNPSINTTIS